MLLRRPWFTRKWVIQEVAKSREHRIVFVAGSKVVSWSALRAWIMLLIGSITVSGSFNSACPWEPERQGWLWSAWRKNSTRCRNTSDLILDNLRFQVLAFAKGNCDPFMVLFSQTLPFRCTDPRDHIIALLGISADYSMREDLVDYTVPAEKLYHRLACACLKNSRDLKILWSFLSVVPLDRRASNSWLTNFDELPNIKGLALTTLSMAQNDVRILNASGSTELTASTSGNRLQIKGRMVDRLEQLGTDISGFPEFERTHDSPRMIREIMTHLDRWLDECEAIAQVASRDDDSFRSTMLIESLLQSIFPDISTAKAEWRT
ncbi:hypothetical protein F5883DRAFT_555434 [Diaporthe sp. PMI_573]|nr:hypothetical protein F5883DRAFT_555434 [Diaporthaceae sp. PMI_573]